MIPLRAIPGSLRLALTALSLALVFCGWSVFRATSAPLVQPERADTTPVVIAAEPMTHERQVAIAAAVGSDPFSPDRTKPAVRYRLAHEVADEGGPPQRSQLRWSGVIIGADSTQSILSVSFGTNQNAPVSHLRIGEKIGDWTLQTFDIASATFQSESGESLKIYNPTPGRI